MVVVTAADKSVKTLKRDKQVSTCVNGRWAIRVF
jgi:hypothetical protein